MAEATFGTFYVQRINIFLSVVHTPCTDGAALHDHIRNVNVGPLNKVFSVLFNAVPSVRYTGTVDNSKIAK